MIWQDLCPTRWYCLMWNMIDYQIKGRYHSYNYTILEGKVTKCITEGNIENSQNCNFKIHKTNFALFPLLVMIRVLTTPKFRPCNFSATLHIWHISHTKTQRIIVERHMRNQSPGTLHNWMNWFNFKRTLPLVDELQESAGCSSLIL